MLIINRAFRPSEPRWQQVSLTCVHRTVPGPGEFAAINTAGVAILLPTFPAFIRGFTANSDVADPLVPAGGATALSYGVTSASNVLMNNIALATWGTSMNGWGGSGPRVSDLNNGVADSGLVVVGAGQVPGQVAMTRNVIVSCNLGTVTGTMRVRFEMRAFSGAW